MCLTNKEILDHLDLKRWRDLTKADYAKIRYVNFIMLDYKNYKFRKQSYLIPVLPDNVDKVYLQKEYS